MNTSIGNILGKRMPLIRPTQVCNQQYLPRCLWRLRERVINDYLRQSVHNPVCTVWYTNQVYVVVFKAQYPVKSHPAGMSRLAIAFPGIKKVSYFLSTKNGKTYPNLAFTNWGYRYPDAVSVRRGCRTKIYMVNTTAKTWGNSTWLGDASSEMDQRLVDYKLATQFGRNTKPGKGKSSFWLN